MYVYLRLTEVAKNVVWSREPKRLNTILEFGNRSEYKTKVVRAGDIGVGDKQRVGQNTRLG